MAHEWAGVAVIVGMNGLATPSSLSLTFLRIGALAFGGLGATLALIERELVERHATLSRDELTAALTYTKLLPGSTVIQVVAYVGWRLAGWTGAALATTCFVLPSAVLMLALAIGYAYVPEIPWVIAARRGVLAAVAALLLVTMARLGRPIVTGTLPVVLAVGAFVAVLVFKASVVGVVIAAGLIGVLGGRRVG